MEHRRGQGGELSFGYRDEEASPRRQSWCRQGRLRHRRRTRPCGVRKRRPRRQAPGLGRPRAVSRDRSSDEIIGLRDVLAAVGVTTWCSAAWGLVAGAGGHLRDHGVELTVLDSSDPDYVRRALGDRPGAHRRGGLAASPVAQSRPTARSGPSSRPSATPTSSRRPTSSSSPIPVRRWTSPATEAGYRVFHANPDVGGRYSALTAFGLVPSGLAGADIGRLLDEAAAIQPHLEADDAGQPRAAARCAARRGQHGRRRQGGAGRHGLRHPGFGDWAEQLIAESTGKDGKGILPVVVPSLDAPELRPEHARRGRSSTIGAGVHMDALPASGWGVAVTPRSARRCCCGSTPPPWPAGSSGSTRSTSPTSRAPSRPRATCSRGAAASRRRRSPTARSRSTRPRGCSATRSTVADAVAALLGQLDGEHGYLAVMAYLDRARRRAPRRRARAPGRAHRPPDHLRLGTAVPALDRAVPQGRPPHRRLPPDHRANRSRTSRSRTGRSLSAGFIARPGRRRRVRPRRPRPTRAAGESGRQQPVALARRGLGEKRAAALEPGTRSRHRSWSMSPACACARRRGPPRSTWSRVASRVTWQLVSHLVGGHDHARAERIAALRAIDLDLHQSSPRVTRERQFGLGARPPRARSAMASSAAQARAGRALHAAAGAAAAVARHRDDASTSGTPYSFRIAWICGLLRLDQRLRPAASIRARRSARPSPSRSRT